MKRSSGILLALGALLTGGAIGYVAAQAVSQRKNGYPPCGCEENCCCNDYDYDDDDCLSAWDDDVEDDDAIYGGVEDTEAAAGEDDISF